MPSSCPFCASTDVAETMKGGAVCLDCDKGWRTKAERQVKAAERRMDWFDRLNGRRSD